MPCTIGPMDRSDYVTPDMDMATPALCGVLTMLEKWGMLEDLIECDWREAGIGHSDLMGWWERHKAADRERRRLEARERKREKEERIARAARLREEAARLEGEP